MTPAGTSNELDVQNEWEENTHTQQVEFLTSNVVRFLRRKTTFWWPRRTALRAVLRPTAMGPLKYKMKQKKLFISAANISVFSFLYVPAMGWASERKKIQK